MRKKKNQKAKRGAVATTTTENASSSPSLNVLSDVDFRSVGAFPQQTTPVPNAPHPTPVPAAEQQAPMSNVEMLCAAIDAEAQSRAAVIRDLTASRLAAFSAAWDLELSKLSVEEQNMPFSEFLKLHPGRLAQDIENLLKRAPTLSEETKRKPGSVLQDCTSKRSNSALVTPSAGGTTSGQPLLKEDKVQAFEQISDEEMRSWYEKHCMRLQNSSQQPSQTPLLGGHGNLSTPMMLDLPGQNPSGGHRGLFTPMTGASMSGVTPKTVRLPKHGEALLSINGSPLGQFGKTPSTTGAARTTRTQSRLMASKRNFRDL